MRSSFKENFNFITNIFLLTILLVSGVVWADSNGVWTLAKDIREGTFGSDELADPSGYGFRFLSQVLFDDSVVLTYNKSCDSLDTDIDGKIICGIDKDTDTNAGTICSVGQFLNGDGSCDSVVIDTNTQLSEAQVDSYADNNGYLKAGFSGDLIADNTVDSSEIQDSSLIYTDTDTSSIQRRIIGFCPVGESIRAISSTGTVTCEVDDSGSVSYNTALYKCPGGTDNCGGITCLGQISTSSTCYEETNDCGIKVASCTFIGYLVN